MKFFHKNIYFPQISFQFEGIWKIEHTVHSARAELNDEDRIYLPPTIELNDWEVIEIGLEKDRLEQFLIRKPYSYNQLFDLNLVVMPQNNNILTLKTCWLNRNTDQHVTLIKEKYTQCKN